MFRTIEENLSAVARRFGIPIQTLHYWVRAGQIKLPDDIEMLKGAKKVGGRWYLTEEQTR